MVPTGSQSAFWGLLAVFGVLVFLFVIQVDEQSVREGSTGIFPPSEERPRA